MGADGVYDAIAGTCGYCHGVGACPRCWGRVGIDRLEREMGATIKTLESRLSAAKSSLATTKLALADAQEAARRHESRISDLHDTLTRADREREACCRETKMATDRLERMKQRLATARLDGWREVVQRLEFISLLTIGAFPAWAATIAEITKRLRIDISQQEGKDNPKLCPTCKSEWKSDGEGGCAHCGHGHK